MVKTIYRQYDSRWGSLKYPSKKSNLSNSGCGCLSVLHCAIENPAYKDLTVKQCRSYMVKHAVEGQGTRWAGIEDGLKHYGYNVHWKQSDGMSDIWKALKGSLKRGVILFRSGKAPNGTVWTTSGHYVAFTDYRIKDGRHEFYCKDSGPRKHDGWYSYERSMKGRIKFVYICTSLKTAKKTITKTPATTTTTTKKAYTGTYPSTKLVKSNAEVIADTIKWAKWIASDNSFHYGYTNKHKSSDPKKWSPNAHHNGCYFCGTNEISGGRSKKGITDYKKTYCCNPYVGAAFAHGGCVPKALELCRKGKSWDYHKGKGYDSSSLFDNLGKLSQSKLKPGYVLCRDTHVMLYLGDGKIAHAAGGDDNVRNSAKWNKSIRVEDLGSKKYLRVHRFNGKVDTIAPIRHGEVGKRVELLQLYLNWYFDGKVGSADGYYGDNTLKWVKQFQKNMLGAKEADGVVGDKTITAMKTVKK